MRAHEVPAQVFRMFHELAGKPNLETWPGRNGWKYFKVRPQDDFSPCVGLLLKEDDDAKPVSSIGIWGSNMLHPLGGGDPDLGMSKPLVMIRGYSNRNKCWDVGQEDRFDDISIETKSDSYLSATGPAFGIVILAITEVYRLFRRRELEINQAWEEICKKRD